MGVGELGLGKFWGKEGGETSRGKLYGHYWSVRSSHHVLVRRDGACPVIMRHGHGCAVKEGKMSVYGRNLFSLRTSLMKAATAFVFVVVD